MPYTDPGAWEELWDQKRSERSKESDQGMSERSWGRTREEWNVGRVICKRWEVRKLIGRGVKGREN